MRHLRQLPVDLVHAGDHAPLRQLLLAQPLQLTELEAQLTARLCNIL